SASMLVANWGKDPAGYSQSFGFAKTGGRFNFNLYHELSDERYDISDMGYYTNNNYLDHYLWIGYKWIKPGKWYNNLNLNHNFNYSRRFRPDAYQSFSCNVNMNGQLKNL